MLMVGVREMWVAVAKPDMGVTMRVWFTGRV